ncbi:MAG: hypothetical protein ABIJ34_04100 [archaeon]
MSQEHSAQAMLRNDTSFLDTSRTNRRSQCPQPNGDSNNTG